MSDKLRQDLEEFYGLVESAEKILNSDATEKVQYDLIFNLGIREKAESLGLSLPDWVGDGSYGGGSHAFVSSAVELRDEVAKVISSLVERKECVNW